MGTKDFFTVAEVLSLAQTKLSFRRFPTAALDIEILLAFTLKRDRSFLYTHPEFRISKTLSARFFKLLNQRKHGVPVAYITGTKAFFGLDFFVTRAVLIPRPDTETLVECVLDFVRKQKKQTLRVLDVGTGSGCIAIALKKNIPSLSVSATDISKTALAVARKNAHLHKTRISFFVANFFAAEKITSYDIIVSNPPYLYKHEARKKTLAFEPQLALALPSSSYNFFTNFLRDAYSHLHHSGALFLEIGNTQAPLLLPILKKLTITDFRFHADLGGTPRVLEIHKNNVS